MPNDKTKTTRLALLALLLLTACEKPLSNEEIVKQTKICTDAGLRAAAWHENALHENNITRIECQPK